MDASKDNIAFVIGFQKKALRVLGTGLTNQNAAMLFNHRSDQKKTLEKLISTI
jgi:tryptophan 2,3-dioxygenase